MNAMRKLLSLLLVATGLAMPLQAMAGQPDWITGDPADYPSSQYLIGRGVGSTEVEAQDRARGDLATIFEVRIQVANESNTTVSKSGSKEQVNRLSSQQVSAKTDKVISGITIANMWRDPATMDFHALAVLPRAQAAANLTEELSKLDNELRQKLQSANDAADPLLKIGALNQALQASIKREGLQAMLKVIDLSGRGVQAQTSQATVQQLIDDAVKQVKIAPEVADDDGAKEFASLLRGGLATAGFLASKSAEADLVLEGRLNLTDIGRRDDWNWMRATVQVNLVEKSSRRVRGSQTWAVKASAQDAKTARLRVLNEVDKALKLYLRTAIIGFAN